MSAPGGAGNGGTGAVRQLLWLRSDLRTHDHPALTAARRAGPVVAVFCVTIAQWQAHALGAPKVDFVLRALAGLQPTLAALGIPLRVLHAPWFADVPAALLALARELGAGAVHCTAEYPLDERRRDAAVARACAAAGIGFTIHPGGCILEPGTVLTGDGRPYTVFTPFQRRWLATLAQLDVRTLAVPPPQADPDVAGDRVPALADVWPASGSPGGGLPGGLPEGLSARWPADPAAARTRLQQFARAGLDGYADRRDQPAVDGTSTLSPWLAAGVLSGRGCLAAARLAAGGDLTRPGVAGWVGELAWRDFYRHLAAAFPALSMGRAMRPETDRVAWREAPGDLQAWQAGRTGLPLVDAGIRQLLATGWMHNRVRMVAAQVLCKHLLVDWRHGERFFLQHLVDADFAANNGGWQWCASTGTDAAPYFRVFNPVAQGRRFDPEGDYVRHWVPELAGLPDRHVHEPWRAPVPPANYPAPIVELGPARLRAIAAFRDLGGGGAGRAGDGPDPARGG